MSGSVKHQARPGGWWSRACRWRARGQDIMTFTQRGAMLATVAITGLALAAPGTAAAASASSAPGMAHRAKGCIAVTATIRVGRAPEAVAADPKTKTIYTANEL